jgi:DNA-binding transcriptional ArsR family regulator
MTQPTEVADDRLSQTFAALANPTRRAILTRLAAGDATVNELADPFDLTLPAISNTSRCSSRPGWSCAVDGLRADPAP